VDIAYVKRSSEFLPTCEQAINESRTVLLAGESISIKFDTEKRGYKAKITVEIREGDENSFVRTGTNQILLDSREEWLQRQLRYISLSAMGNTW